MVAKRISFATCEPYMRLELPPLSKQARTTLSKFYTIKIEVGKIIALLLQGTIIVTYLLSHGGQ